MTHYYKFIGDIAGSRITPKQEFYVEVEQEEQDRISAFPYPRFVTAKIVCPPSGRNNLSGWITGDVVSNFLNPYHEFSKYGHAPLIKISKDLVPVN